MQAHSTLHLPQVCEGGLCAFASVVHAVYEDVEGLCASLCVQYMCALVCKSMHCSAVLMFLKYSG